MPWCCITLCLRQMERRASNAMTDGSSARFLGEKDVILVTGAHGLLGRAVRKQLEEKGCRQVLSPSRAELDYTDAAATRAYFLRERPAYVFHLASVVFGLLGNMMHQVEALATSTLLNHNVIMNSAEVGVRKLFFAGSVASYPFPYRKMPLTEEMFWNGDPHQGEYGYAHAKRHALAYLQLLKAHSGMDFFYGILTNLYGPEDRFDDKHGHVIPSLIKKMHRAKHRGESFRVWGDGSATRDFMYVVDAAAAVVHGMENLSGLANISSGETLSIRKIVEALSRAAEYSGETVWETERPVGIPERSVSADLIRAAGFRCDFSIDEGMRETWNWFEANAAVARS